MFYFRESNLLKIFKIYIDDEIYPCEISFFLCILFIIYIFYNFLKCILKILRLKIYFENCAKSKREEQKIMAGVYCCQFQNYKVNLHI